MATKPQPADEVVVQLATRVPEPLLQRVKLFAVSHDMTMGQFIEDAIRAKLRRTRSG